MNKNIIFEINDKYLNKYLFFILSITISLSIIKINILPISLPIDSYGYISFSDNLFNQGPWQSRPFGYPLFLKISRIFDFFGLTLVILFQIFFYILASCLIYISFKKYSNTIAFSFALIYSFTPAFQWININTLADGLYAFFPVFIIFYTFKFFEKKKMIDFFLIFLLALITSAFRPT